MDEIKINIRQARFSKGMSLEEVSEETGYSVERVEWLENNPGDMTLDEAWSFCELYGGSVDEVSFSEVENKEEYRIKSSPVYPLARNLQFTTNIMNQVSEILLFVSSDPEYTKKTLFQDLKELLDEIQYENEALLNGLTELVENKNHLNLSLAGR